MFVFQYDYGLAFCYVTHLAKHFDGRLSINAYHPYYDYYYYYYMQQLHANAWEAREKEGEDTKCSTHHGKFPNNLN